MSFFISRLAILVLTTSIYAQAPEVMWQKSLGGTSTDEGFYAHKNLDGSYIITSRSNSTDGDVLSGDYGNYDAWVVKLDPNGSNIVWEKKLGGSQMDSLRTVTEIPNQGGYLLAGHTASNDGDVSGNHGQTDFWIVKLDYRGKLLWQKCVGTSSYDYGMSLEATDDGKYVVAGYTGINGGDALVAKIDPDNGDIVWQKTFGDPSLLERALSIKKTLDGGFLLVGANASSNNSQKNIWVSKIGPEGALLWERSFGENGDDQGYSSEQTIDGGYIVIGISNSTSFYGSINNGNYDAIVIKLNGSGNMEWSKCLGSMGADGARHILKTVDGNYIISGYSSYASNDVNTNHGSSDAWVAKINGNNGNIVWENSFGGSGSDYAWSIHGDEQNGLFMAGITGSSDETYQGGGADVWIIQFNGTTTGINNSQNDDHISIYPVITSGDIYINVDKDVTSGKFYIMNLLGQTIKKGILQEGKNKIELSSLSEGYYLIKITGKKDNYSVVKTQKILLRK